MFAMLEGGIAIHLAAVRRFVDLPQLRRDELEGLPFLKEDNQIQY